MSRRRSAGQAMRRHCRCFLLLTALLPGCSVLYDACWRESRAYYASHPIEVDAEIDDYKRLVEETLTHRAKAVHIAQRLKDRISEDKPLSGGDLDTLNQGMLKHMRLRDRLYSVARRHECWIKASPEDFRQAGLGRVLRQDQLKAVMLSLSAALLLYDNYLMLTSVFVEDAKLRRFLNDRDSGYDIGIRKLDEVTMSYSSVAKRERVRRAMRFYEDQLSDRAVDRWEDPHFVYLRTLIDQSPSYAMTRPYSPLFVVGQKLKFMGAITLDSLDELKESGPTLFSAIFGNTIGLVETRSGKLRDRPEVLRTLSRELRAGDILLEKTPFRLTDKFIPGYWGHAAIWVGTATELKELGIWGHPVVVPHHEAIEHGEGVLEVLRSGVQLNTLRSFLNVDSLALLRHSGLDRESLQKRIVVGFRQVGKQYDFRFDIETTDVMSCTELVYLVHSDIEWSDTKVLGHHTINPDQVAAQSLDDGPLRLIALYHDGERVIDRKIESMEGLLDTASSERHPGFSESIPASVGQ